MKRFFCVPVLLVMFFIAGNASAATPAKPAPKVRAASCAACHPDWASALPQKHPAVKGRDLSSCLPCHKPAPLEKASPNSFSARIHRPNVAPEMKVECTACHGWVPGKSFTLPGQKTSLAKVSAETMKAMKEAFASWAGGTTLDSLHGKRNVTCAGCHGKTLPEKGDTVENDRCLTCHGKVADLVAKTAPKDHPDRNPHESHLGEIACAVCHHAHKASEIYCLGCHPKFPMKIPGGR
jgi:hypothetical protein